MLSSETIVRMSQAISHRGPDSGGEWSDNQTIALGHRRLAIVDISSAGDQPMQSASGRYTLVYNGEIYNHLKLRREIDASGKYIAWAGHSDTETLLECFDFWGIEETLQKTVGMFAMAVWDREGDQLTLARDRMGEKPLYYGWQGAGSERSFLFASELKALKQHPVFQAELDRNAVSLYLRHNCIPAPYTIYQGIKKLTAGCLLRLNADDLQAGRLPEPQPYWSLIDVVSSGLVSPVESDPDQIIDHLEELLSSAIDQQMMADVPLGAFLSGGVDSSTIVALMQSLSSRQVKTFSIGFTEQEYNEAEYAKAVAKYLGTDHTELYVSPNEAMDVIPKLPTLYDEPFSDSSQIPTYLVSRLARQQVTVALSGDAGDELFCGYNRYRITHSLWRGLQKCPVPIRRFVGNCITSVTPDSWNRYARWLPYVNRYSNVGDKAHKAAEMLDCRTFDELYRNFVSHWRAPADILVSGSELETVMAGNSARLDGLSAIQQMMLWDSLQYLPDDILVKVDRAAMGASLETRVPFLDHRVVEFAWRLPQSFKLREGKSKWILRQVLYRHVPQDLIERPKMGFGVPIGDWLRGSLRNWAESLLDENRLQQEGIFYPMPIRQKWSEHLSGKRNWQYLLWDILMFQSWLENEQE